jgi:hypothetical protein
MKEISSALIDLMTSHQLQSARMGSKRLGVIGSRFNNFEDGASVHAL